MARVVPSSNITLYSNIKVRKGMGPVFTTAVKRETYFQQHIVRANSPCTYVRRTGELKVEVPLSVVNQCNYISFVNPSFENRIWYCFITNFEYDNNECTIIEYVVDPLMTYMFDFNMLPCMLSRQMLSQDDTVKANTNPYDPSIWQFTTDENLMCDRSLEKPVYNLKRYTGGLGTDGNYMLSTQYISEGDAYDYDIGKHVMAVLFIAPLSVEKLDEGVEDNYVTSDEWATVREEIETKVGDNIPITPGADDTLWNSTVSEVIQYLTGLSTSEIPTDYSNAIQIALTETTHHVTPPGEHFYRTRDYFMQVVDKAVLSVGGSPSAQWTTLLQKIIDAGGYIFECQSSYVSGNGTYAGRVPHSSFSRGYDIIAIPNMIDSTGIKLFSEMINKLTTWDAISQIIGVYAINDYVFRSAFVDSAGVVPSPGDIAQNNIYTVPTSFTRMQAHYQHEVSNKKLLTFPFSYIRVSSPDGNVKEYKYEDFQEVMNGTGAPEFKIMGDLNSHPSILMAPIKYKRWASSYEIDGVDMSDATNVNLDEMITYDEFAQVPFVTDAYLTYLSQQVMNTFAQNTLDYQDQRTLQMHQARLGLLKSEYEAAKKGIEDVKVVSTPMDASKNIKNFGKVAKTLTGGSYLNAADAGFMAAQGVLDYASASFSAKHYEGQLDDARVYLAGNVYGDIDWERYNGTKPAHANNVYHPGTNGGIYHYLKGITTTDFILEHVQLRDTVLDKYDRYFTYYGYNEAGRADTPYIYNFMRGESDTAKLPTWNTDDENDQITYVQTMDAHVTNIPLPYAQYLELLFNNGYRFINGDALIS